MVAMAMIVLLVCPSPVRSSMPAVTAVAVAAAVGVVLLARALPRSGLLARILPRRGLSRLPQVLRTSTADIGAGLLARGNWPGIVLASVVAVTGHLATFVIAARTAGATAPLVQLVPLTLLALLAMGLPVNVGGWGPREGVAAWAFGAAGLTVAQGVATAVVYGALVLVASLPGACVLMVPRITRMWRAWRASVAVGRERPV
jgi:hypothetical protein